MYLARVVVVIVVVVVVIVDIVVFVIIFFFVVVVDVAAATAAVAAAASQPPRRLQSLLHSRWKVHLPHGSQENLSNSGAEIQTGLSPVENQILGFAHHSSSLFVGLGLKTIGTIG